MQYRAWMCPELGSDLSGLQLLLRTLPPPGQDPGCVRVRAAALNFPDLLMTRGLYQH
jgi:NADPH2:quinone reductase